MKIKRKNLSQILTNLALVSQIGITIIVMIVGSIFIGRYLDKLFKTGFVFLGILVVLSAISAFYYILKIGLRGVERKDKKKGK